MYAKLPFRNVRRTAKDYLIYVVTLVLSIGMFYGFFSLVSPYYNETLPVQIHLDTLKNFMRMAVPLVGLLAVFLMSYVNSYMLRRKQKEFAVETIIGMEQRTVAFLFFLETLIIGAAAIVLGVLLGILLSQIISMVVVQSFGETYGLHFALFPDTLLGTVVFFGVISLLMGLKNLYTVRKLKVIQMLQNSQKGADVVPLTKQLKRWGIACMAVSFIILLLMILLLGRIFIYTQVFLRMLLVTFITLALIVSALAFITAGKRHRDGSRAVLSMTVFSLADGVVLLSQYTVFESMVRQGIALQAYLTLPPILALFLIVFGLIAFFSNLTWLMAKVVKKPSVHYYNNLFLSGQLKSRMGSSSKMMGMITCVLAASLVLFAYLPVLAIRIQSYQQVLSVYDVQVGTMYRAEEDLLPSGALDFDTITIYLEEHGYTVTGKAEGNLYLLQIDDLKKGNTEDPLLAVPLSVYNELRGLSGLEPIFIAEDEYGIAWSNVAEVSAIQEYNEEVDNIQAGTITLHKAKDADYQDSVGISLFTSQTEAVYIIPDDVTQGLRMATTFYSANTDHPLSYEFAKQFDRDMAEYQTQLANFPADALFVRLNTLQTNEGISNMLMLILIGAYTALVLLVSSFTMLSIQQLTDAIEQKHRFKIISMLGVELRERRHNIRRQMEFWFGLPVLTALICSAGVLVFLIWSSYKDIIAYISMTEVLQIFGVVYIAFLAIFVCYFGATYYLFQKNMDTK